MTSARYCPSCGAKVEPEGARFCRKCGRPLDGESSSPAPVPSSGPAVEPGAPAGTPNPRPRRVPVSVIVSVAVICVSLVVIVLAVIGSLGRGGSDATDGDAMAQVGNVNAASEDDSSQSDGQGNQSAEDDQVSQADADVSQATDSGSGDGVDPILASLDGWWTIAKDTPERTYIYFLDGEAYTFSSSGQQIGSWTPVVGEWIDASQFGEGGYKVTAAGSDSSQFLILSGDSLYRCWYDGSRIQYSGGESLVRCGSDAYRAEPSFAASAEQSLGAAGQPDGTQATSGGDFTSQRPTITGWVQQPLPNDGSSGFIWRVSWTPVEGADGYEVRRWDLDTGVWVEQELEVTAAYTDFAASASEIFGAQVRAYRGSGSGRTYSQWSDRSDQRTH